MTALCFGFLSTLNDIHKVSCALKTSGISYKTLVREREKYLFDRYCREVNAEFAATMENQSSKRNKNNVNPNSRIQVVASLDDIEFPEEVEEGFLTAVNSSQKVSTEDFLTCERFASNTSSLRSPMSSEVYWTANDDSNQLTLVPSLNLKTDSAPTSPLDDLTLRSESTTDSKESFIIPMIEEHTGREETMADLIVSVL